MAIVGPWVSWLIWTRSTRVGASVAVAVFCAAGLATRELCHHRGPVGPGLSGPDSVLGATIKFGGIYAITQIPLAIAEGLLTVVVMDALSGRAGEADEVAGLAGETR